MLAESTHRTGAGWTNDEQQAGPGSGSGLGFSPLPSSCSCSPSAVRRPVSGGTSRRARRSARATSSSSTATGWGAATRRGRASAPGSAWVGRLCRWTSSPVARPEPDQLEPDDPDGGRHRLGRRGDRVGHRRRRTYNGAVGVDVDGSPLSTLGRAGQGGRQGHRPGHDGAGHRRLARRVLRERRRPASRRSEIARQYIEDSEPDVILGGGADGLDLGRPARRRADRGVRLRGQRRRRRRSADDAAGGDQAARALRRRGDCATGGWHGRPAVADHDSHGRPRPCCLTGPRRLLPLRRGGGGSTRRAHANDGAADARGRCAALEDAVRVARELRGRATPDTLLIVTGDHDSGRPHRR